jgi:hypothetical protein
MNHRQNAIRKAHRIFNRIKETGNLTKEDTRWIDNKKQAKLGNGHRSIWYPELDKIATYYGLPHTFK